jgi:hypothetical protein
VLMLVVHLLHLHYPAAAQMGVLKTIMMSSMGSAFVLQSAACGGLLRVFLFRC